jgi:DnaA family protein
LLQEQLILELAPAPTPTLANFVPGRNAEALAAASDLLSGGGHCLYLWGGPGSGRSHLLRALAAEAARAGRRAYYAAAPRLAANDLAAADWLAVDDVEQLDELDQIELFDAFNRIRARADGALFACGDRPPSQLPLREDLRTRLASGVTRQLHALSDEEKAAALAEQARERGLKLGEDMLAYLLSHVRRDMGTLVAVLDALDRSSLALKRPVTLPLLRDALAALKLRT